MLCKGSPNIAVGLFLGFSFPFFQQSWNVIWLQSRDTRFLFISFTVILVLTFVLLCESVVSISKKELEGLRPLHVLEPKKKKKKNSERGGNWCALQLGHQQKNRVKELLVILQMLRKWEMAWCFSKMRPADHLHIYLFNLQLLIETQFFSRPCCRCWDPAENKAELCVSLTELTFYWGQT